MFGRKKFFRTSSLLIFTVAPVIYQQKIFIVSVWLFEVQIYWRKMEVTFFVFEFFGVKVQDIWKVICGVDCAISDQYFVEVSH